MHYFERQQSQLFAEKVSLTDVACNAGTPTYVYSEKTLTRHVKVFTEALKGHDHLIAFAIKACANLTLLHKMQELGSGFDAVSGGELKRAQAISANMNNVILSGVGKTNDEIEAAIKAQVRYICVESEEELTALATLAVRLGVCAPIAIRVNPDVDAKTHPYISTGMKDNKFGVPMERAEALYLRASKLPGVKAVGISCHIGSQITSLAPFEDAARRLVALARKLLAQNVPLEHIGFGGGLGISYTKETPPEPAAYAELLLSELGDLPLALVLEPGRVLVGNAGILLTRVTRVKTMQKRRVVILDAGMNDLMRPALYGAEHRIEPVSAEAYARPAEAQDIVGPVCESSDAFARGWMGPRLEEGDLVCIFSAGAYGMVMASNYNGRALPAEVLCDGNTMHIIREREPLSALWRQERQKDGKPWSTVQT